MSIPDYQQCLKLMDHYRMPEHIREHSLLVAKVACVLADALRGAGLAINPDLAQAGGLLHDIAKIICIDGSCSHALRGGEICIEHGLTEVAPLVSGHVYLHSRFSEKNECTEAELVYYADKRVCHNSLVCLQERRDELIKRYAAGRPDKEARIVNSFKECEKLEEYIFSKISRSPDELTLLLPYDIGRM